MSSEETLSTIRGLVQDWVAKRDHESCWFYFEILKDIADTLGIEYKIKPSISRGQFKEGCHLYQLEIFGPEYTFVRTELPDYLL